MIKQYRLTLLSATAITLLSLLPMPEVPSLADTPLFDKWVHFVMYGWLSVVMRCEQMHMHKRSMAPYKGMLNSLIIPTLLGGVLELCQSYLTTCRSGDWWDLLADAIGACLGTILGIAIYYIRYKRRSAH
ncbi:MAG: VanZ family protein [Bacteroidales bacterium]|nr:VanZ family protein [Candidatus Physcousia equi]